MGAYSDFQNAVNGVSPYTLKNPEDVAEGLNFTLQSINPQSNIYRTTYHSGNLPPTDHLYSHTLTTDPGGLGGGGGTTWRSYLPQVHYVIGIISEDPTLIPDRLSFQIVQTETVDPQQNPNYGEGPITPEQCRFINSGFTGAQAGGEFVQMSPYLNTANANSNYHTYTHPFDPDFVTNRLSWERFAMFILEATDQSHTYSYGSVQSPITGLHTGTLLTNPTYSVKLPDSTTGGIDTFNASTGFVNDDALTGRIFITKEKLVIGSGAEFHLHENHQQALANMTLDECGANWTVNTTPFNAFNGFNFYYDRFGWQDLYISYDVFGDGSLIRCAVVKGIVNPCNMLWGEEGQDTYAFPNLGARLPTQSSANTNYENTYHDPILVGGTGTNPQAHTGYDYTVTKMHSLGTLFYEEECTCDPPEDTFEDCKNAGNTWECEAKTWYGIAMGHGDDMYAWAGNIGGGWLPVDYPQDSWISYSQDPNGPLQVTGFLRAFGYGKIWGGSGGMDYDPSSTGYKKVVGSGIWYLDNVGNTIWNATGTSSSTVNSMEFMQNYMNQSNLGWGEGKNNPIFNRTRWNEIGIGSNYTSDLYNWSRFTDALGNPAVGLSTYGYNAPQGDVTLGMATAGGGLNLIIRNDRYSLHSPIFNATMVVPTVCGDPYPKQQWIQEGYKSTAFMGPMYGDYSHHTIDIKNQHCIFGYQFLDPGYIKGNSWELTCNPVTGWSYYLPHACRQTKTIFLTGAYFNNEPNVCINYGLDDYVDYSVTGYTDEDIVTILQDNNCPCDAIGRFEFNINKWDWMLWDWASTGGGAGILWDMNDTPFANAPTCILSQIAAWGITSQGTTFNTNPLVQTMSSYDYFMGVNSGVINDCAQYTWDTSVSGGMPPHFALQPGTVAWGDSVIACTQNAHLLYIGVHSGTFNYTLIPASSNNPVCFIDGSVTITNTGNVTATTSNPLGPPCNTGNTWDGSFTLSGTFSGSACVSCITILITLSNGSTWTQTVNSSNYVNGINYVGTNTNQIPVGTHTILVTTAGGCTATTTVTIPSVSTTSFYPNSSACGPTCFDGTNGMVLIGVPTGSLIVYNNGNDVNGFELNYISAVYLDAFSTTITQAGFTDCNGSAGGTVYTTLDGAGVGNPNTTASNPVFIGGLEDLSAGVNAGTGTVYTFELLDQGDPCNSAIISLTITEPDPIELNSGNGPCVINPTCNGLLDGSIDFQQYPIIGGCSNSTTHPDTAATIVVGASGGYGGNNQGNYVFAVLQNAIQQANGSWTGTVITNFSTLAAGTYTWFVGDNIPAPCSTMNGQNGGAGNGTTCPSVVPFPGYVWDDGMGNLTYHSTCYIHDTFTITDPALIVPGAHIATPVMCFGDSNGTITFSGIPPTTGGSGVYTYTWTALSGGPVPVGQVNVQDPTGLPGGIYEVEICDFSNPTCCVTDANQANVLEPPVLAISVTSYTDITCAGIATGEILVAVTGGVPGYTYVWTTGGGTIGAGNGTPNITGLTGTFPYTCTVTDANGCIVAISQLITDNGGLPEDLATDSIIGPLCPQGVDGQIRIWITNGIGAGPFYINLSIDGGAYFRVQTNGGIDEQVTMLQLTPGLPFLILGDWHRRSDTGNLLELRGDDPGTGDPSCVYSQPLYPTDYQVQLESVTNGCLSTEPTGVVANSGYTDIDVSEIIIQPLCCDPCQGEIDITVLGGIPPYTYVWTNSAGVVIANTQDVSGLCPDTYTLTVTDACLALCGDDAYQESYVILDPKVKILDIYFKNPDCIDPTCAGGEITIVTNQDLITATNPNTSSNTTTTVTEDQYGGDGYHFFSIDNGLTWFIDDAYAGPLEPNYEYTVSDWNLQVGGASGITAAIDSISNPLQATATITGLGGPGTYEIWVKDESNCDGSTTQLTVSGGSNFNDPLDQGVLPNGGQGTIVIPGVDTDNYCYADYNATYVQTGNVPNAWNGGTIVNMVPISALQVTKIYEQNITTQGGNDGQLWFTIQGGIPPYTVTLKAIAGPYTSGASIPGVCQQGGCNLTLPSNGIDVDEGWPLGTYVLAEIDGSGNLLGNTYDISNGVSTVTQTNGTYKISKVGTAGFQLPPTLNSAGAFDAYYMVHVKDDSCGGATAPLSLIQDVWCDNLYDEWVNQNSLPYNPAEPIYPGVVRSYTDPNNPGVVNYFMASSQSGIITLADPNDPMTWVPYPAPTAPNVCCYGAGCTCPPGQMITYYWEGCAYSNMNPPYCDTLWKTGGPTTGLNDQGAPGSIYAAGQGTLITNPVAFFAWGGTFTQLWQGDVIQMPSGNIWQMSAPGSCTFGCYDPETAFGASTGHWCLCPCGVVTTSTGSICCEQVICATIDNGFTNTILPYIEDDCQCDCPEGYVLNIVTGECEGWDDNGAILNSLSAPYYIEAMLARLQLTIPGTIPASWGSGGAILHSQGANNSIIVVDSPDLPFVMQNIPPPAVTFMDSAGVTISQQAWSNNITFWQQRLEAVGIWADKTTPAIGLPPGSYLVGEDNLPLNEHLGFAFCVDFPGNILDREVVLGFAADAGMRIKVDGITILELADPSGNETSQEWANNSSYWHLVPIIMPMGKHTIEISGINYVDAGAFGFEMYSRWKSGPTDFINVMTAPTVVYNSGAFPDNLEDWLYLDDAGNKISTGLYNTLQSWSLTSNKVFTIGSNQGYSCDPGYWLSNCGGAGSFPTCVAEDVIDCADIIPCPDNLEALVHCAGALATITWGKLIGGMLDMHCDGMLIWKVILTKYVLRAWYYMDMPGTCITPEIFVSFREFLQEECPECFDINETRYEPDPSGGIFSQSQTSSSQRMGMEFLGMMSSSTEHDHAERCACVGIDATNTKLNERGGVIPTNNQVTVHSEYNTEVKCKDAGFRWVCAPSQEELNIIIENMNNEVGSSGNNRKNKRKRK